MTAGKFSKIRFGSGLAVTDEGAGVITVTGDSGTPTDISGKVDRDAVETATARLVAVKLASGDTQPAFRILGDGTLQWGQGGTTATDVSLFRSTVNVLRTLSLLQMIRPSTSSPGYEVAVSGDATARIRLTAGGVIEFGPGNAATDVNLYRVASGAVGTDGKMWITNPGPVTNDSNLLLSFKNVADNKVVLCGAADSGGAGFRLLRIAN